jgi:hypothetical protein
VINGAAVAASPAYARFRAEREGMRELAGHTPSSEYIAQSLKRRAFQLIGVKGEVLNTLAPLPYQSEYPFSTKVMDSVLTIALDPIVKPMSLKGDLDRIPILKKMSKELADRGYFQKYPKGGIGIGGGPGGGGGGDSGDPGGGPPGGETGQPEGTPATSPTGPTGPPGLTGVQPGPDIDPDPGTGARGFNAETGFGARPGTGTTGMTTGPPSGSQTLSAFTGGWGSFASTAMSVIGSLAGLTGFGLAGAGFGYGMNLANTEISDLAARAGITQAEAAARIGEARGVGTGGPQGGGGFQGGGSSDIPPEMSNVSPAASPGASVPGKSAISPSTRANAAARVGGGIAPDFLAVLQGLQG